ncbi:MAG: DUF4062 domain-containing protein [Lewinellaceae bacterium]|nr:DUF4062 domain-containing protein [Lewinellaceae bacterium]
MKNLKIFLSSTSEDLLEHRKCVAASLPTTQQVVLRMESFGSQPLRPAEASLAEVEECDLFVGLYAHRYGAIPPDGKKSFTEMELDYAWERNKAIFCFIIDDSYPWPPAYMECGPGGKKLQKLKNRIRKNWTAEVFTSPDNLASKVTASISRYLLKRGVQHAQATMRNSSIENQVLNQVAWRAQQLAPVIRGARVLLVNDNPQKWASLKALLLLLKVDISFVQSTEEALTALSQEGGFDAVVSDIIRGEDKKAGLKLLAQMHKYPNYPPLVFTVTQFKPELGTPAYAFGIANNVDDILNLLFDIFERRRWRLG